ncbi:LacI family DNA-binding transcriptional regulator [Williamsia sp. CHRR-6]|uniref:LacI family DNA-binding transcriptional regulator n=1 Tax=Williamsia sp. CHRR-6 TaxID=2835871 RepID=UPI001BDACACC|nr:LacI family DNA-binding transcriptional regulator [Williamsia sp. CHRR-6]MBT0566629.1 LacI family DNA-binding transcriptional regulator [Williamsia sp. CHRR-6]
MGRVAEVSAQTVSRYFTGSGYVSAETRVRIEDAVAQLGYRHNRVARNLRVNHTDTIGVLTLGQPNHGNSSILMGLGSAARSNGFSLVISQLDTGPDPTVGAGDVRRALDNFMSMQVDAIAVATPYPGTEALMDRLWETVPVLALTARPWAVADTAIADSRTTGAQATNHLLGLGHRRILHLAGPVLRNETEERRVGYLDAMAAAQVEAGPVVFAEDWTAEAGAAIGSRVDTDIFTAVFAANDELALGFLHAMRERGLHAPHDFSIVGVDDMPDTRFFAPPLTTVRIDFQRLGFEGFGVIHRRIMGGEGGPQVLVSPELIVRKSTGSPRPR